PRPRGPLERSQSAFVPPTFTAPRSVAVLGRSRDSRAWEFYCDSEARDELTKQAEREQSGSAIGAIGLIRSRSKGCLAAGARINNTTNKRVSPSLNSKKPENQKRLKADDASAKPSSSKQAKPTKLKKTEPSAAALKRLQNPLSAVTTANPHINKFITDPSKAKNKPKPAKNEKKAMTYIDTEVDGNESDKENWAPGTQTVVSPVRQQPRSTNTTTHTRILRENESIPTTSTSLGTLLSRTSSSSSSSTTKTIGTPSKRNRLATVTKTGKQGPKIHGEIAKFMAQGIVDDGEAAGEQKAGAGEEDLNCVQGLLSLSQGEWR
ncbi:MAG: hypothetical protein Q9218_005583, partial [Villophora microphyllina]